MAESPSGARGVFGVWLGSLARYAPPLDGWPFVGGEAALARCRLGLGWDARDAELYAPPFGEVEF